MKRTIIYFGLIILMAAFASAGNYSKARSDYYSDGTYYLAMGIEDSSFVQYNGTTHANGDLIVPNMHGWASGSGTLVVDNTVSLTDGLSLKVSNGYIRADPTPNSSFTGSYGCWVYLPNDGNVRSIYGAISGGQYFVGIDDNQPGVLNYVSYYDQDVGDWLASSAGAPPKGSWFEIIINHTDTGTGVNSYVCYENRSCQFVDNGLLTSENGLQDIEHNSESSQTAYFDNCWISKSDARPEEASGTVIVSSINCTSCNYPDGDNSSPYLTEDTTPTFTFSTNINAWCRVHNLDQKWSVMGAARDCNSGDGTTSHTCTLKSEDALKLTTSPYVYIGCRDSAYSEGDASTAQFLMEFANAEAAADAAMEKGINLSMASGATIFSEQKVYVRRTSNQQALATFDKVAAYKSQRWGLNYVSDNETGIGAFFNVSPAFYFIEMRNISDLGIISEVGKLINNTLT